MAKLIPETDRMAALQSANLSAPVLRLASGEAKAVHPDFAFWCETPYYGYFADRKGRVLADLPWGEPGDTLVPLWACGDTMTLFRQKVGGATDFVQLSIEDSRHELWLLGETEPSLLADLMISVVESLDWQSAETWDGTARQTAENAAQAVGFRFLEETFTFLDTVSSAGYSEEKKAFTRSL